MVQVTSEPQESAGRMAFWHLRSSDREMVQSEQAMSVQQASMGQMAFWHLCSSVQEMVRSEQVMRAQQASMGRMGFWHLRSAVREMVQLAQVMSVQSKNKGRMVLCRSVGFCHPCRRQGIGCILDRQSPSEAARVAVPLRNWYSS